jgi:hypothetical protein
MKHQKCSCCSETIDTAAVQEIINEDNPYGLLMDRPMESYTEHEQALRLGMICHNCFEAETEEYVSGLANWSSSW